MKKFWFIYQATDKKSVFKIKASRKPSLATTFRTGTWILVEHTSRGWEMPSFPEIPWNHLKYCTYIGRIPC